MEDVLDEVKRLVDAGVLEFVLSGIHTASYGRDLKQVDLLQLIQQIHRIDGVRRIRISSLESNCIQPAFVEGLAQLPKLCPQFHLSLQSGCDETLRRMNRHYTADEYADCVALLRQFFPNAAITTDVMVGFAGETEEEFQKSLAFVEKIRFSQLHVFPYSIRKGTRAATFPDQVPPQIKEERAARMIALGDRLAKRYLASQAGKTAAVLVEREREPGVYEGYTPEYIKVQIPSDENICGRIVNVALPEPNHICGQR